MTQNESNPYVGPRPFERNEEDSARFFGRSHETQEIVSLIFGHPVILVYAQSGAGKTSLFNASITLNLEENGFEVLPLTRVGGVIPKEIALQEIGNLYIFNSLLKMDSETDPRALLPKSLPIFLETRVRTTDENGQPRPRAIIFDQFEELFTYTPEDWREQREGFFLQVIDALNADPLLRVVFVIREDFLAELDPYVRNLPERLRIRYRLERLGESAALRAIKDPIANTSRKFASGVAEELVKQLLVMRTVDATGKMAEIEGQYVEPVQLQVICVTLWSALGSDVTEIQQTHLKNFNVNDALAHFYESAIESAAKVTSVREANLRNWFGKTLITPLGTRSTVFRGEDSTGGIKNSAVDFLESQHIIRAEFRAGARWYELTHDRLMEPILANNQKWLENLSPLQRQSALWNDQGRNESWLLSDQALIEVEQWAIEHSDELMDLETEFLKVCKVKQQERDQEREREIERQKTEQEKELQRQKVEDAQKLANEQARSAKQARRLSIGAFVLMIVAIIALVFATSQRNEAQQAQMTAQADSLLAAANEQEAKLQNSIARSHELSTYASSQLGSNPPLSILLSVQAYKTNGNAQSKSVLLSELQKFSQIRGFLYPPQPPDEIKFGVDSKLIATRDKNGITIWDTDTLKPLNDEPINGHYSSVYSLAFSPDGKTLASGGLDGSIILWNTTTRQKIGDLLEEHTKGVWSIAFSPDGKTMASGSVDTTIILWDMEKHPPEPIGQPLRGHKKEIVSIGFSPDGKMLASGSGDNTIILWDMEKHPPEPSEPLTGHKAGVWGIAFSPDGKILASGSSDNKIILWDMENQPPEPIGEPLSGHTMSVRCIAFSPDGKLLASGGYDKTVILWDVQTHEVIKKFTDLKDKVYSVAFSGNGAILASGSSDGTVTLFDVEKTPPELMSKPLIGHNHNRAVLSLTFNPVEGNLASGSSDTSIILWDLTDVKNPKRIGEPLRGHPGQPTGMAFSPRGKFLISNGNDGTVVFNLDSQKLIEKPPLDRVIYNKDETVLAYQIKDSVTGKPSSIGLLDSTNETKVGEFPGSFEALTQEGKILISSQYDEKADESTISLWNTSTGRQIGTSIKGFYKTSSADGKYLVVSTDPSVKDVESTFILWDTDLGKQIGDPIRGLYRALSEDGKVLVISTVDGDNIGGSAIGLWDTSTGKQIGDFIKGSYNTLSTNGKVLVSTESKSKLRLSDTSTGKQIGDFINGFYQGLGGDGNVLVACDGETEKNSIGLWKTSTGEQIGDFITGSYQGPSGDGTILLVSGDNNSVIRPLDVNTGRQIGASIMSSYKDLRNNLSPDGKLMFRSTGELIAIWNVQTWMLGSPFVGSSVGIQSAAISPNDKIIASYAENGIVLQEKNGKRIGELLSTPKSGKVTNLSFSPDNKLLASCDETTKVTTLWNLDTQKPVGTPKHGCFPVFSPDGKLLAISDLEKKTTSLYEYNLSTNNLIETVSPIPGLRASFSNDGKRLVIVEPPINATDSVGVDSQNITPTTPPIIPPTTTPNVAPTTTPTGTSLGSIYQGLDNTLALWDISQKPPQLIGNRNIPCPSSEAPCMITAIFNPKDLLVYSNGLDIFTLNSKDFKEPGSLDPDITTSAGVTNLYFILQGQYLISEDSKGYSTIWNINTNSSVGEPFAGKFQLAGSNPNGSFLLYLDQGGNLISWDLDPTTWIDQLCKAVGRNFNPKEWHRYFPDELYSIQETNPTCSQWPIEPEVTTTPKP